MKEQKASEGALEKTTTRKLQIRILAAILFVMFVLCMFRVVDSCSTALCCGD